jgi:hypothetical protein
VRHPALRWMVATLDGRIQGSDAVFEAKFMLPWSFSEEAAAEKAFEAAGIEFIDENGTGEGVRFRKPRRATRK